MPRLMDDRVGFFSVRNVDYGRDEHEAKRRSYITRWKLEKKDPSAALSEPVTPLQAAGAVLVFSALAVVVLAPGWSGRGRD